MTFDAERSLTDQELALFEMQRRYEYAIRLLGVNINTRAMMRVILLYGGEWTPGRMADATAISRTVVRDALNRNARIGLFERGENGFKLTPLGRELFLKVHCEGLEISLGQRAGFSVELIHFFRQHNAKDVWPEANKIKFPKKGTTTSII
jgi:hypothetical protein